MIKIMADESNFTKSYNRKIEYIVIHYTANNGDTAKGNGLYFQRPNLNSSAHYFIDENEIVSSVDEKNIAWHCGGKFYKHKYCRNNNSIGIEMCSKIDKFGNYYIEDKTIKNTIILVKALTKKYNIKIENVIRHYDVTGKNCPEPFVKNENLWKDFKSKIGVNKLTENDIKRIVQDEINKILNGSDIPSNWAKNDWEKGKLLGLTDGTRPTGYITREQVISMILRQI